MIGNSNSNKENLISRTNIYQPENDSQYFEDSSALFISDDEKGPLIMKDLKSRILPMDLSNILNLKVDESKKAKEKTFILKDKESENSDIDYLKWEDEDELSRLSFYLNFLSVYVIYLNDKNVLLEKEEENSNKENDEIKEEFSFNKLSNKIKEYLDFDQTDNKTLI